MLVTVDPQAGESPLLPVITELGRRLARFDRYQPHTNDVSALSSPRHCFGSRCIDLFLAASTSFVRWERCRIVQVPETRDLCAEHPVAARAAVDSDATVLASVVRPSLEMYVELIVLQQAHDSTVQDQLCQFLLWQHFAGDVEQKLTSCQEIYGCRPSYFEAAAAGWRQALERARKDLGAERVQALGKMSKKYVAAFKAATPLERLALGPDSFLAHAGLAYKLHFLPQKNVVYGQRDVEFLRSWCSGLLVLAGQKLCTFLQVDAPAWLDAATVGFLDGFAGTGSSSPQPGSIVFYDWGVGIVEAVERQPLGNEVLTIRYEVQFVPDLKSPDRIPRRFVKCELHPDKYRTVCRAYEPHITENAYQSESLGEIYTALFRCRLSADAAQQGV